MDKFGHFYFAYGSNLNDWRGLGLRPVGPATLPDEVLVFDHHSSRRDCGTLNIRRRRGDSSKAIFLPRRGMAGVRSTERRVILALTAARP